MLFECLVSKLQTLRWWLSLSLTNELAPGSKKRVEGSYLFCKVVLTFFHFLFVDFLREETSGLSFLDGFESS